MTKVIKIIACLILCFAFASGVSIANQATNKPHPYPNGEIVKDMVGMDTLVDSLQSSGMVKVVLSSPNLPTGIEKKSEFQAPPRQVAINGPDEAAEMDVQMLMTALVLVGVIAFRRII